MNDRPGFMSLSGAVVAGALLLSVAAWTLFGGPDLFSPGRLSAFSRKARVLGGVSSHAQLSRCSACHTPPWSSRTMADLCLGCHTDVASEIRDHAGLHGRLVGGPSAPTCRGCHTEHRGPAGALTVADASFPHDLAGYSLRGHRRSLSGARVACVDCHPKDLAHFDQAVCSDCHAAIDAAFMSGHVTAFGKQCLRCHDGSGRNGADFDHNSLPFRLSGKHSAVKCERCHPNAVTLEVLRNTPRDCVSCHAKNDKHRGAFGRQCDQCHTPYGWAGARFDHSAFPVDHGSGERKATCQTCHPTDVSTYDCFGCHEHTPANIQARHEGRALADLADCVRCHPRGARGGD